MAYNKFKTSNGTILLDLTPDTVTPETLVKGVTAHDRHGEIIEGTLKKGAPIEVDALDNSLLTSENDGKVYKYDDKLYQVHKITSLKGLTIKFNEHITPCPVIGEDDEFECSGVLYENTSNVANAIVTKIKGKERDPVDGSMWSKGLVFDVYCQIRNSDGGYTPDVTTYCYYSFDWEGWHLFTDSWGFPTSIAIANFDCHALNENPEFIEWVLANGKVYTKIENASDIKVFRVVDEVLFFVSCTEAEYVITNSYDALANVDGQYTASFSVNGELITKTFSSLDLYTITVGGPVTFSDGVDTLSFNIYNGERKYNDIVLDDTPIIFTAFDWAYNDSYFFLSSIITNCEPVDMEYPNGYKFVEYAMPTISFKASVKTASMTITNAKITVIDDTTIKLEA